jgi:hypothetical protein
VFGSTKRMTSVRNGEHEGHTNITSIVPDKMKYKRSPHPNKTEKTTKTAKNRWNKSKTNVTYMLHVLLIRETPSKSKSTNTLQLKYSIKKIYHAALKRELYSLQKKKTSEQGISQRQFLMIKRKT